MRFTLLDMFAVLTGLTFGLGIWLCSPNVTGQAEAWDAPGYYYTAVLLIGVIGGIIFCGKVAAFSASVGLGQFLGYFKILYLTGPGPLWPIGVILLLGFSFITAAAAVIASTLTKLTVLKLK